MVIKFNFSIIVLSFNNKIYKHLVTFLHCHDAQKSLFHPYIPIWNTIQYRIIVFIVSTERRPQLVKCSPKNLYIYIIAYSLSQIICRIFVATQNFSVHVVQSTHFRVITQVQVRSNEGNLIPTLLGMVGTIAVNRLGSRKIALQYDFLS